jgi:dihydrofolate synthase/folylpolyglutamate synthase
MEYEEALDYLLTFVNYEKKMAEQYAPEKMDPDRPARLLRLLGDPHREFPSLHIAGSKGKGSVAAMCAAALRAAGLRVGLYTSPHLQDFRERIRVLSLQDAEGLIAREQVADLVSRLRDVAAQVSGITYFELVTALAFMHFAWEQVDVAVVEVGLGGRLDATNVLLPLVSVITHLELEHTALLGNTLREIATEKGGIIKPHVPVVSAPQAPEALAALEAIAAAREAPFVLVGRDWQAEGTPALALDGAQQITLTRSADPDFLPPGSAFTLSLLGEHQQENALVALAALAAARQQFVVLTEAAVREGLASVHWPGRLQLLQEAPAVVADGAHTPEATMRLARTVRSLHPEGRLWLVVGATADKDVSAVIAPLLPEADGIFATQADHPRAASSAEIAAMVAALGYQAQGYDDVCSGLRAALAVAAPEDLIVVTGSLFVVGDLLNCWENLQSAPAASVTGAAERLGKKDKHA